MKKRALFGKEKAIYLIMVIAAIVLSVKYIFVDFGIDAEFQISMSYRLLKGDVMFRDMWEPYQMSAFFCAFFMKIYMSVFRTTTGIVLYLQTIGVLVDMVISCFLYRVVKKYLHCDHVAFAMAWVFFLVSPKDIPTPDYTNMQMWFSMLLCITMFLYYRKQKKYWLVLSAMWLCGAVLSYPSCLILFLGVVFLLLYRKDKTGCVIFGASCFFAGVLYLCFVFKQVSFDDFIYTIQNMLSIETSHSTGLIDKFFAYLKDGAEIVVVFLIAYAVSHVVISVVRSKKESAEDKEFDKVLTDALFFLFILLISTYTVVFWSEYIRYCYSLVFIAIILIGTRYIKKLSGDKYYFYLCGTVISLLQFVATLLLTNLQVIASVPYLLIAVIVAFLPISEGMKPINDRENQRFLKAAVLICAAIFLTFRNAYIIRPMNGDVSSIMEIAGIVKSGPAVGIVSEYMGPYMQNESIKEWQQYIETGDSIYLIGGSLDTLGYLYSDTIIAAPSLVPTPGYNESILEYWESHPDKYPDVIIASCWYGTLNTELTEDSWIMRWIEEVYKPQACVDGKYWRYYFR